MLSIIPESIEIPTAVEIYEQIVKKTNTVPQLAKGNLTGSYYEHISHLVNPLFDFWLSLEIMTPRDEKERNILFLSFTPEYIDRLVELLAFVWDLSNFAYMREIEGSGVMEVVRDARQVIW